MLTVKEILTKKIGLDIECVDRIYLNGYVKYLQIAGGLITFIREQMGYPIPSAKVMRPFTAAYRKAVEQYAKERGLEIVSFEKHADKDQIARNQLKKNPRQQGVVLIGKAQEKALGYKAQKKKKGKRVWFDYSRQRLFVTYYYFYILDEDFGLFFIKVCTYFPFDVKECFNGHEWAKQQLRKEGIGFEALQNGLLSCEDPHRLQTICHQLNAAKVQALFDHWVEQIPWLLSQQNRAAGYRHQLSIWQMEGSRTQVFEDREQGWALFEGAPVLLDRKAVDQSHRLWVLQQMSGQVLEVVAGRLHTDQNHLGLINRLTELVEPALIEIDFEGRSHDLA